MKASRLTIALMAFLIAACSHSNPNDIEPVLPDDPNSEVVDTSAANAPTSLPNVVKPAQIGSTQARDILENYSYVDPTHLINQTVLQNALLFYDANKSSFTNQSYITVVDFTLRSDTQRFFIVNMSSGAVWGLPVAHGMGSDPGVNDGYAKYFSNTPGSNMSSLGAYRTAETYTGTHGYSLRIDGLQSTNSNARSRAIVVHVASYVQDARVIEGRSNGCFALPMDDQTKAINMIKSGSLIFAGLEK